MFLRRLNHHDSKLYFLQFLSFFSSNSRKDYKTQVEFEEKVKDLNKESLQKSQLYFSTKSITEITEDADRLFEQGLFLEVYELLNRQKFNNDAEVQWRICRALFKMSTDQRLQSELRKEMIFEAYSVITSALDLEQNNANVYKWMAIIMDLRKGIEGLDVRVQNYTKIRDYLRRAIELNPEDPVTLYILGKWYYEMSSLTILQRLVAKIFYGTIPKTTFEEAYEYLLKSTEVCQDNYYIPTLYMLGKICVRFDQMYRARYYLRSATTLPARTKFEAECARDAQQLLTKLDYLQLRMKRIIE